MNRSIIGDLEKWKSSENRKPLIIRGARQVGKTWVMKEFGSRFYDKTAYINFEMDVELKSIFDSNFDIQRILLALQAHSGMKIEAENTLIIFDEIQEAPRALTCLKYFCENHPEYHILAAGSLLGVAMHGKVSFPVGKVDFIDLKPLSFLEFLDALNLNALSELLIAKDWELIKAFKSKLINLLRQYFYIGGMPEAVASFIEKSDFNHVRAIQNKILASYEQDFSKHAPSEIVPRIRMFWNSILQQLSRENKKFVFGLIKEGARAREFEMAMQWLIDCGLIYKISRISKPGIPLKAYEDLSAFKIFVVDIGLLCAMGKIDIKTIIDESSIFEEFKGATTEQFILQQLVNHNEIAVFYWSSDTSVSEIDFVIQSKNEIIALEVKAGENLQAKSLKSFKQKYPEVKAIRTSLSDYREESWMTNIPLFSSFL